LAKRIFGRIRMSQKGQRSTCEDQQVFAWNRYEREEGLIVHGATLYSVTSTHEIDQRAISGGFVNPRYSLSSNMRVVRDALLTCADREMFFQLLALLAPG
jgi:hypothetical protein